MKNINKSNLNHHKKNLEKMISQQKEHIKIIENEDNNNNNKMKSNAHRQSFSPTLNSGVVYLQNQNLKYENELNTIKLENINLKQILYEKEKIILKFQNVVAEAKIKMEQLLLDNKRITEENQKLKEKIIRKKKKDVNKINKNNDILNEVQNLRNELFNIEKYYVPQMQEKNIEIQNLEINKENLENNLKQSISTRSLNNNNNINNIYNLNDNNNSNINLSKYNSDRNFKNRKPPLSSSRKKTNMIINIPNNTNTNDFLNNYIPKGKKDVFVNTLFKKNNGRNNKNYESFNSINEINYKPPLNNYITKLRNQFEPSVKIQDRTYEVYNTNY